MARSASSLFTAFSSGTRTLARSTPHTPHINPPNNGTSIPSSLAYCFSLSDQKLFRSSAAASSPSLPIGGPLTSSGCPFSGARFGPKSSQVDAEGDAASLSCKSYSDIPTPKGLPFFGTTFDLLKHGGAPYVHEYCDKRHKELGPIYREKMGTTEGVFIADSQLMQKVYQSEGKFPKHMVPEPWTIYNKLKGVQRGLFFMDGPEWAERRKSLNKVFLKQQIISEYTGAFNEVITDLLKRWAFVAENESSGNGSASGERGLLKGLEKELYNWSIESLGAMIFGRRLGCVSVDGSPADSALSADQMHDFVHCVQQIFVESGKMTMIPPQVAYRMNLPVWRRFSEAAGRALELARIYVEDNVTAIARAANSRAKSTGPGNEAPRAAGILEHLMARENIEQEEVVRIVTDLFLAAADTTSHATQWALYLLAQNPECQERLLQEVNSVAGEEEVQEHHLAHLPYVKGVIKEALRLYPVAPFLTRILDQDIVLGGYRIPAGMLIALSLYTTGRDEKHFSSPNTFRPERWLRNRLNPKSHDVINTHACLPFGLGVRSCIGRRVAEVQMQFLLSRVIQNFKIRPGNDKKIGIKLRMITTPEEPIHLLLERRQAAP